MKTRFGLVAIVHAVLLLGFVQAEVQVTADFCSSEDATAAFKFQKVPTPARNDAAAGAKFTLVDGRRDGNGGGLEKLHDGFLPTEEDQPRENFFFAAGADGGRILVDLGSVIDVKQVNSYSWHPKARGPQVYKLYAGDGRADGFNLQPKKDVDPKGCGWALVAEVSTRPKSGDGGGQHGVSISDSAGLLGKYRYLLLDVSQTTTEDPFANTFWSEIDVIDASGREIVAATADRPSRKTIEVNDGKYQISIDITDTPDLKDWVEGELVPVMREWYPKIVEMLPSEGYEAPRRVNIVFSGDMQGVAATGGTRVSCAAAWFRSNLKGEAKGAVVHELVHVAQQYRGTRRGGTPTPGWVVEGIADYIRWFLYEPQTRGAEISTRNAARARYDASYRTSANFLNWVVKTHDKDLLRHLNAAAREGRYSEAIWKERTGSTVQELGEQWKKSLEKAAAQ